MHAHFHHISWRLLGMGISLSFHPNLVHDSGSLGRSVFYISSSSHFPSYCNDPPYLCFSFVSKWYAHNWFCLKCVTCFFVITGKFWSIKTFNITDEVCSLVSIGVRLVYITSSRFSCTWVQSSYSRCSSVFFAICGVFCIKGIPIRPQHDHWPSYVLK